MLNGRGSALARLHKSSISIKDIANQSWCEKQMELYLTHGMFTTKAMQVGQAMHDKMHEPMYIKLSVEPVAYPDRLYKTAYENYTALSQLREKGICREVKIYGSINGFRLAGQIDELRQSDGKLLVVEDKTKNADANPEHSRIKQDSIQIALYKKVLGELSDGMYTYENFANSYSLSTMKLSEPFVEGLKSIGIVDSMMGLEPMSKLMFSEFRKLPEISNTLELRYFSRSNKELLSTMKFEYNKEELDSIIKYDMGYWSGSREAQPVGEDETWKCRMCRFFGKECTVWYNKV